MATLSIHYGYDALGNLTRDDAAQIEAIEWTVAGKVKAVESSSTDPLRNLTFGYGTGGNRIMKQVGPDPSGTGTGFREHYIRDAQGNIMAVYRYDNNDGLSLKLTQRPLYGSSRQGTYDREKQLHGQELLTPPSVYSIPTEFMSAADRRYELTVHLGNVAAVVTGQLIPGNGATPFQPMLVSAQDYEAFGSLLPGRNYSSATSVDPDALVVDENFEGASVVGNQVNGWNANAVAVLSMDEGSTRRLKVSNAIQWDGAQLNFVTIPGETYTLTFDLDMGNTATIGLAIYNPSSGIPPAPTWTTGGSKTITFTATTGLTRIKIYKISNTPTTHYFIDNVKVQGPGYLKDSYRFGFNGQEKDDEVYGATGSSYTAEFWQYDTRIARRWNPDPIVKHHESRYAAFANSPIWIIDQFGADSTIYLYSKIDDQGNAMYSMDQLNTMATEAQNIANLNGLDYVKFKATTLHDLETNKDLNLNPYTDLIYRVADDIAIGTINPGATASSLSNTVLGPNSFQDMTFVHGEIYPNEVLEAGVNFNVTAGITIAHEAFTHGYNNVVSHLFGKPVWSNHGGTGLEGEYGTRFYGNSYTTLRLSEATTLYTNTVINQLFNFGSGPFATGMPKGLDRYKYSGNDAINTYFRGVIDYHFKK